MRKLVFLVFLMLPLFASALTAEEIQAQIQALLKQIEALESQIPQSQASAVSAYCPTITRTLARGDRDATTSGQVSELQKFLAGRYGLSVSDIVTGYFGAMTERYVLQFQAEQGLPQAGVVGPMTRAAIAAACHATATAQVTQSIPVNSCFFGTTMVAHGASVTAYLNPAADALGICESEVRTCRSGYLSGSFQNGSCTARDAGRRSCAFGNFSIEHGASVLAYHTLTPADACESQIRTCYDGSLSGSYEHAYCFVQGTNATQTANTNTTGATTTTTTTNTNTGTGTGTASAASCTWNGQTYTGGQTVTGSGITYTCETGGVWVGKGLAPYATYIGVETGNSNYANNFAYSRFGLTPRRGNSPLGVSAYAYVAYGMASCGSHTINWGDGTVQTYPRTSGCLSVGDAVKSYPHTYMSPGTYTVTFTQEATTVPVTVLVRVE